MTLHDTETDARTGRRDRSEPQRPPTPGGISMRPAMIVVGLAALILVVFVTIGIVSTQSPAPVKHSDGRRRGARGPRCGPCPRPTSLVPHRRRRTSRPTTSSTPSSVPAGSVRVSHQNNSAGAGQYDSQVVFRSGDSQAALLAFFAADMKLAGLAGLRPGAGSATTRGPSRSWASSPGSDGYYWEMGATVDATTFTPGGPARGPDPLHRPAVPGARPRMKRRRGPGEPRDVSSIVSADHGPRLAGQQAIGGRRRLGQQVGPDEEVDRVEQVAHPRVRGQQDQRGHHDAGDRADLRRRLRRVAVEMAGQEDGQHDARRRGAAPG